MNLSREAGDLGLIPVQGTKIPHAMEQLSPTHILQLLSLHTTTKDPTRYNGDPTNPNSDPRQAKKYVSTYKDGSLLLYNFHAMLVNQSRSIALWILQNVHGMEP